MRADAPVAAIVPHSLPGRIAARIPWFTLALSGVLAMRFLGELRAATDYIAPDAPGHFTLLALGASSRDQVLGHGEWWRLFTATMLHGSPAHLIGNLVTFLTVGFLLEPMIGIGWFSAIYFSGGSSVHPALQYCAGTQVGIGDPAYYQQPSNSTALGQSFSTVQTKLSKIRIMQ